MQQKNKNVKICRFQYTYIMTITNMIVKNVHARNKYLKRKKISDNLRKNNVNFFV